VSTALVSANHPDNGDKAVPQDNLDGRGGGGGKQKRGLLDLGYGGYDAGSSYGTLGGYGLGSAIKVSHVYSPRHYYPSAPLPTHVHTATTITKSVPVLQPYPVTVEKPVPYPVAAPYPVQVDRPYPVPVPKPYPVAVDRPYPVHVDRPYPVHVPQPYVVPVIKHVGVPVPQPYPVHGHHSYSPALSLPYHRPLYSDHDLW